MPKYWSTNGKPDTGIIVSSMKTTGPYLFEPVFRKRTSKE
jgi:hypothetical protein